MEDQPPTPPHEPPIPPVPPIASGAQHCLACGGEMMPGARFCLHCGARQSTTRPGAPGVLGVLGMIFMALAALLLGAFGACTLVISSPSVGDIGQSLPFLALGLGAFYAAFLCLRNIVRSIRAMRDRRDRPQ